MSVTYFTEINLKKKYAIYDVFAGIGLSSAATALIIIGIFIVVAICGITCFLIYRSWGRWAPNFKYRFINGTKCTLMSWGYIQKPSNADGQFINVVNESKAIELISDLEIITTAAISVGLMCLGDRTVATCFRVGTKYIMTAFHVLVKIMETSKFILF